MANVAQSVREQITAIGRPCNLPSIMTHLARAGGLGAIVGMLVGVASLGAKLKKISASDVDVDMRYLARDECFQQAYLDLKQFRDVCPPRSSQLFDSIGDSCNHLVECSSHILMGLPDAPGVTMIRAHRYLKAIERDLDTLGKCIKTTGQHPGIIDYDRLAADLKRVADNHIHNMLMSSPYENARGEGA